jgi:hypothetical protein
MKYAIADGLNIDPMLVMMAFEAETIADLDAVLDEIERQQDMALEQSQSFINTKD